MKGFIYMLEAVLAGILLLSFLGFVFSSSVTGQPDSGREFFDALERLDRLGLLREPAENYDFGTIESLISLPGYEHSVQVCDPSLCQGDAPEADEVMVSSYFLAGSDSYSPREVRLFVWVKE